MALSADQFRAQFPAFADATDEQVEGVFELSECWLGAYVASSTRCRDQLYYLLAAHLLYERTAISSGSWSGGAVSSSSVGGVSVSVSTMPPRSEWAAWLSGSPYGAQLMAFLRARAAGGRSVGGSFERWGYRKAGGVFPPH